MTSNPHEQVEDEDEDVEVEVVDEEDHNTDSRAESAITDRDEKPVTFYKFGPRKTQSIAIDVSLNKLNKCLKVAYNKMTTPKWKDFKGIRLPCSQRIRLNNVIWRAYYMEFRKPKKPKKRTFCYFAVPDDDATHTKIGGSVLEGMYWKRRMKAVCAQYKRWRHFVPKEKNKEDKNKETKRQRIASCSCEFDSSYNQASQTHTPPPNYGMELCFDEDDMFPDSILDGLDEPFWFPNVREIQSDNADTIQPGLLPLQANMPAQDNNIEEIKKWMASSDDNYIPHQPPSSNHKARQTRSSSVVTNSRSVGYSPKDYDAANVLVDYSNQRAQQQQQQPPPNPSTVPEISIPVTPALMSTPHMTQPFYSQAVYGQQQPHQNQSFGGHQSADSPFDAYAPQFLAAVASTGASPFSPYGNMVLGGGQNQANSRPWIPTSNASHWQHSIHQHLQHQGLQPVKQLIVDKPPSSSPFSCDSLINFGGAEQLGSRQRTVSDSIAHLFHPMFQLPTTSTSLEIPYPIQATHAQPFSLISTARCTRRRRGAPTPSTSARRRSSRTYFRSRRLRWRRCAQRSSTRRPRSPGWTSPPRPSRSPCSRR
uniref:BHLH domain-containing protein n=1 Tax=Steinernema glaseri TaxID=37863 RepID=A0A1I7YE54_9BILA